MEESSAIVVSSVLGKDSAILHSDGLIIFEKMMADSSSEVTLCFLGIEFCTFAFLNASVGKFILATKGTKLIKFTDTSLDIQNKIKLVQDNTRDEKKRAILENAARSYLALE